jgi:hypothetical protein
MFLGEPRVKCIPLFAWIRRGERDVKAAPEQFNLCLRFVIPITALPRPGVAGSGLLRQYHNTPPLPFRRIAHGKLL